MAFTSKERAFTVRFFVDRIGGAGWSSPVARQAHNLKVAGSNPAPATSKKGPLSRAFFIACGKGVARLVYD